MDGPQKPGNQADLNSTQPFQSDPADGDDAGIHGNMAGNCKLLAPRVSAARSKRILGLTLKGAAYTLGWSRDGVVPLPARVRPALEGDSRSGRGGQLQHQRGAHVSLPRFSLFARVRGTRALKHTTAPVGWQEQPGPQSTPRLVGVIAHFTSPPTHPDMTQPPELHRGPRPPRPPKQRQKKLYPSSLCFGDRWARQDELTRSTSAD